MSGIKLISVIIIYVFTVLTYFNRFGFLEDAPSKAAKKAAEEAEKRPANIRVMEVQFFSNNTFATVAGLGESILRGKFHIVGDKRDQLSMIISRFGFGRDVSGSVYRYVGESWHGGGWNECSCVAFLSPV